MSTPDPELTRILHQARQGALYSAFGDALSRAGRAGQAAMNAAAKQQEPASARLAAALQAASEELLRVGLAVEDGVSPPGA